MSKTPARTDGLETSQDVTRRLSAFLVGSRWEDIPADARHAAKRSLLNYFGTALGGCRDEAADIARQFATGFSAAPEASVIGRTERLDILNAAFVNAISANVFDFDDTHHRTIIHPTAPVAPALFAMAERQRMTGPELLHAFVLGVEVECRLGNAVSPWHYKRGWHITSTCGVFGAAAAIGKFLQLDTEHMTWALGNASAQSSGLVETLGSMAKSVGVGNSARNGLVSALLAENGLAGPERPLEGPRGFLHVMGDKPDYGAITDSLGRDWEVLRNIHKPYPCGIVLNPVIDACLELRNHTSFAPDRVRSITVHGHSLLRERADRPSVTTGREAQVSAHHSVAVALLFGAAGVVEYSNAYVLRPDVLALRSKVKVVEAPGIPVEAATVTITLINGAELTSIVRHARGTPEVPMTDSEIEAKVRQLAAFGSPGCDPGPLIDALWAIEDSRDAGAVMALARPKAAV